MNADWPMKRVFFFLILLREEGKITRSRFVLRSPSNASFNRETGSRFSATMESRFELVKKECIEELKDKSEEQHGVVKERFEKVGE